MICVLDLACRLTLVSYVTPIVNKIMYGGGDKRKTLRQTSYESGDTQVVSDTRQTILSKFSTLTNLSLSRAAILLRH